MTAKVVEGFSSKLAEQWVANLLTPAFVFWAGGLAAYTQKTGWNNLTQWYSQYSEPLQIGILVLSLCIVVASAVVVQRFDIKVLRALEGYWYPGLRRLLQPSIKRTINHRAKLEARWLLLNDKVYQHRATASERAEYVRLERTLRQFPKEDYDMLPTRLGNILRAAERRPYDRYGLDAIICWPRLWLLLPDSARQELQAARAELNNGVRIWTWSILFLVWTIWAWWAIPCAIVSALFAYGWILDSAIVYGDLIESGFDLYRISLYQSLRFPLPTNPAEERAIGLQVTAYLFRGSQSATPQFTSPSSEKK